jgi:hypothetical protein
MSNNTLLSSVELKIQKINDTVLQLLCITEEREHITFAEFYKICTQPKYQHIVITLTKILGNIPWPFYWECAPIKHVADTVQIYLVKAQFNMRKADIHIFENQITSKNKNNLVLHFPSITGISELIIANPIIKPDTATHYTHMRNFMRYADDSTCLAFWSMCAHVAMQFLKKYGIVYLKTHGHGVNYFHFRLQKTNAYYVLKF